MIKIDLDLSEESEKYVDSLSKRLKEGISKYLVEAMVYAETQSKDIFINETSHGIPKPLPPPGPLVARSGDLRRSIESGAMGNEGWVKATEPYGILHEIYGVGRGKRPFLMPTFEEDTVYDIILSGVMKELK